MEGDGDVATDESVARTELVLMRMLDVTKCSNNLPKLGEKYELYSSYAMFSDLLEQEGRRLKELMNHLLRYYGTKASISGPDTMDEMIEVLEKANDVLAERIANSIDEAEGKRRHQDLVLVAESLLPGDKSSNSIINTSWNKKNFHSINATTCGSVSRSINNDELKLMASRSVPRPQLEFQTLIDNSNRPFTTKLSIKHNAHPAGQASRIRVFVDCEQCPGLTLAPLDYEEHHNPYKYELDHFAPTGKSLLPLDDVKEPTPVCDTKLQFIKNEKDLRELCRHLKTCSEFAVDLEHHSYRTFQGITCLMQISTRCADYIVDTLRIWKSMHILNDPFTDPGIVKVFHGADRDVEWLQRDFGIYVVNMFDTGQAMRVLGMARFSLAHLVKSYLGKDLNKQFQLADWRIRPLPHQLIDYAREDTHYLLFCYDKLKNELLDSGNEMKNLLISVFERSRDICSKHYEKLLFDEEADYAQLIVKWKKPLNSRQKVALKELYAWRDSTARAQDESLAYVLPNHMLLQMAEVLPREMQGLLSCCNPVPPLVKQHLQHLHGIVLKARQSPLITSVACESTEKGQLISVSRKKVAKPHDFSHCDEEEEAAPVLERILAADHAAPTGALPTKQRPTISFHGWKSAPSSAPRAHRTPYQLYLQSLQPPSAENASRPDTAAPVGQQMYSHLTNGNNAIEAKKDQLSSTDKQVDAKKRKSVDSEDEKEHSESETIPLPIENPSGRREKKLAKRKKLLVESVKSFDYSSVEVNSKTTSTGRAEKTHFDPHSWKDKRNKKSRKFGARKPKTNFGE